MNRGRCRWANVQTDIVDSLSLKRWCPSPDCISSRFNFVDADRQYYLVPASCGYHSRIKTRLSFHSPNLPDRIGSPLLRTESRVRSGGPPARPAAGEEKIEWREVSSRVGLIRPSTPHAARVWGWDMHGSVLTLYLICRGDDPSLSRTPPVRTSLPDLRPYGDGTRHRSPSGDRRSADRFDTAG